MRSRAKRLAVSTMIVRTPLPAMRARAAVSSPVGGWSAPSRKIPTSITLCLISLRLKRNGLPSTLLSRLLSERAHGWGSVWEVVSDTNADPNNLASWQGVARQALMLNGNERAPAATRPAAFTFRLPDFKLT